jgi:hypothetical protein
VLLENGASMFGVGCEGTSFHPLFPAATSVLVVAVAVGLKVTVASGSSPFVELEFFESLASLGKAELSGESGLSASSDGDSRWL